MKHLGRIFYILTIVTFSSTFVYSQQAEDTLKETKKTVETEKKASEEKTTRVYSLGEMLVRDKAKKPGTVSIINEQAVKDSTKTDAINLVSDNVASFYTGNNRVMGFGVAASGAATMSIRGIGASAWSPQTGSGPTTGIPILINGMDAGMMVNNHPVADIFSMKNIERIEVLLGPQPVLYGGGAMGGIINVITKRRKEDGYNTEVSASYGSWNTTEDYVMHYGKLGDFDYGVTYDFRYTDGAREQTINGYEFDSQYMSHNGTVHAGYQVNSVWYAGIDAYMMSMNFHDPGAEGNSDDELEYFDINRGGTTLVLSNSYGNLNGSIQLYGNWGKHESCLPAYDDQDEYSSFDQMLGLKAREALELDFGMTLTGGVEARHYGGKAESENSGYVYLDDKYIQEGSVFALVDQSLFHDFWILSAGGRYTYNSEYGSYGAWQAGTTVNPFRTTKVHFQSAQGFKVPDLMQYYVKWSDTYLNAKESDEDLKPETYISLELGIEQSIMDALTLSVTGYRIYSKNKFTKEVVAPMTTEWYNADAFNYNGLEASLEYRPVKMLALTGGYSYIDNKSGGRCLPYVPGHKLISGIRFEGMGLMVNLNGQYVKDIYANEEARTVGPADVPLYKLDDFFVMNLKVAYSFLERYRVFLDLNNLTNNEYAAFAVYNSGSFYDYPMPGFSWRAGASVTF